MTIVYISTPFFADCDFPLVKELRNQGCRVIHIILITPRCLKSTLIDIDKQYPHNGIFKAQIYKEIAQYSDYICDDTYIVNRTYTNESVIKRINSSFQLYKFIRAFHCDYVWTSLPFGLSDLILYALPKIVLTVHDPFPHSGESNVRRTIVEKLAYRLCNKFVLLNHKQSEDFIKLHHIKPTSVLINSLGTYDCIRMFVTSEHKEQHPYILFYGRISPYKGLEYLLESFVKVHNDCSDLRLIIAGKGNYHFDISPYQKLDYIEFRNYHVGMRETASLFNGAAFVVCPYLDATQSGVVMTAFTMNKAVIATNVGALEETVIDNITGLIVPPKDSKSLYQAITRLYNEPKLLENFERNIKNNYTEGLHSWSEIVKKYLSFLKSDL